MKLCVVLLISIQYLPVFCTCTLIDFIYQKHIYKSHWMSNIEGKMIFRWKRKYEAHNLLINEITELRVAWDRMVVVVWYLANIWYIWKWIIIMSLLFLPLHNFPTIFTLILSNFQPNKTLNISRYDISKTSTNKWWCQWLETCELDILLYCY